MTLIIVPLWKMERSIDNSQMKDCPTPYLLSSSV